MNFTNMIYGILWVFVYYCALLIVPYGISLLTNISVLAPFWSTIPTETNWLISIFLYVVIPLVAIAYIIRSSSSEQVYVTQ